MNDIKKKRIRYVLLLLCLFNIAGCGKKEMTFVSKEEFNSEISDSGKGTYSSESYNSESDSQSVTETCVPSVIFIYLCGEIKIPGVYELPEGARVFEAVAAAGGFTEDACMEALNQAAILADGMQIYIPTKEEYQNNSVPIPNAINQTETADKSTGLVNINTATAEELCTLPGIGESRAKEIISYREQNGNFSNIEEIQNVTGIKEGLFSKIRDKITI